MTKLVSVVVINWNGETYLRDCFTHLFAQNYKNFEVILVDNGSIDNSVSFTKKNYPRVRIVKNKENLGYSEANNIGYKHTKGDYILFLNNDTKVTKTFITELVKVLESDTKIAGAQSKILLMDDPKKLDSVGAYLTLTGFLYYYGIFKKDSTIYNKQIEIFSAKGAAMMFKRSILEKVKISGNILDTRYFAYFEETDMCHRIWLAGYKIVFAPRSIIYHKMGATSSRLNNGFVQYHSFKNRINSYIKNLSFEKLCIILPIHLMLCELYAFLSLLQSRNQMFVAIQKAIWWNVIHLPETLRVRTFVQQSIRNVSDEQLFKTICRYPKLLYYYKINELDKYKDSDFLGK